MKFPVDITLEMMSWRASLRITDADRRLIGFVPGTGQTPGQVRIFADESLVELIYWIKSEHGFTQWFEDGHGRRLGEFGIEPIAGGKFISVGGTRLFHFVKETPWVEYFERQLPNLPILNGLTGAMFNPAVLGVRVDGGEPVLRIVKRRLPIDIRYTLHSLGDVGGQDLECLMLSALVTCLQDHFFNTR